MNLRQTVLVGPLTVLLTLPLAGCNKETPPPTVSETPATVVPPAPDTSRIGAAVTNALALTNQVPTMPPVPRIPPVPPMPTPPIPPVPVPPTPPMPTPLVPPAPVPATP